VEPSWLVPAERGSCRHGLFSFLGGRLGLEKFPKILKIIYLLCSLYFKILLISHSVSPYSGSVTTISKADNEQRTWQMKDRFVSLGANRGYM